MGDSRRAAHRWLARRVSPRARKHIAGLLPGSFLQRYRRMRTDAYLVSFPKCGRTWLRVMLGRTFQQHFELAADADLVELHHLAELDSRVPCVVATHDVNAQFKAPEDIHVARDRYGTARVVLLVRDPRDVIVSLYHQRHSRLRAYDGTMDAFLDERVGGFASLLRFYGEWAEHVDTGSTLVVRYEDLQAQPEAELRRVLEFVGVNGVTDAVIAGAVAFASFDHMRQLEETGTFATEKLRPVRPGQVDSYKTRRGVVGGHRDELTTDQIARLDDAMARSAVRRFGYGDG